MAADKVAVPDSIDPHTQRRGRPLLVLDRPNPLGGVLDAAEGHGPPPERDLSWHRHADDFAWARYPTAVNPHGDDHFARLIGRRDIGETLRRAKPGGDTLGALIAQWTAVPQWSTRVRPVLLYPRD